MHRLQTRDEMQTADCTFFNGIVYISVADLGEGPGGPIPSPLFSVKNEEMTEGRKADWASQL